MPAPMIATDGVSPRERRTRCGTCMSRIVPWLCVARPRGLAAMRRLHSGHLRRREILAAAVGSAAPLLLCAGGMATSRRSFVRRSRRGITRPDDARRSSAR
jgi:hypothetical protein